MIRVVEHFSLDARHGADCRSRRERDTSQSRQFRLRPDLSPFQVLFRVRSLFRPNWVRSAYGRILMWLRDSDQIRLPKHDFAALAKRSNPPPGRHSPTFGDIFQSEIWRDSSHKANALLQCISAVICAIVPISRLVIFHNSSLLSRSSRVTSNFSPDSFRFRSLPSRRCSRAINSGLVCRLSNELANDEFR
jgi:hypothetical protein